MQQFWQIFLHTSPRNYAKCAGVEETIFACEQDKIAIISDIFVQQPQCEPLSPPGSVPQPGDGVVEEEGLDEDEEVDHDPGHGHHTVTGHDAVTCHVCELVPHDTDHDTSDTGHH